MAVLGTGVLGFQPISDGDRVPIVHGPQGGYHVWGAVLCRYVATARLKLLFTLSLVEGNRPIGMVPATVALQPYDPGTLILDGGPEPGDGGGSSPRHSFALPGGPDGWGESLGTTVFVGDPRIIDGQKVRLHLDVTDSDARLCSDERVFVAYLPH